MARLKGGTHVSGSLTVENTVYANEFVTNAAETILFANANTLTTGYLPKISSNNILVNSSFYEDNTTFKITDIQSGAYLQSSVDGNGSRLDFEFNSSYFQSIFINTSLTCGSTTINSTTGFSSSVTAAFTNSTPFTVPVGSSKITNLNADLLDGASLSTATALGTSNILIPSQNAVKTYADTKLPLAGGTLTGSLTIPENGTYNFGSAASIQWNSTDSCIDFIIN